MLRIILSFCWTDLTLLLLFSIAVTASPISVGDLAKAKATASSSLQPREQACPGHMLVYSALMALPNPSAVCSSLGFVEAVTVTATAQSAFKPVKGITTTTVVLTSTITSTKLLTQMPANAGLVRVTSTAWATKTVTIPGAASVCTAAAARARRDVSADNLVVDSSSSSSIPQQSVAMDVAAPNIPAGLRGFSLGKIKAGCDCLSLPASTTTSAAQDQDQDRVAITATVTKTSIKKQKVTVTSTVMGGAIAAGTSTLTTTLTRTTTLTLPASLPTLFYLRTSPLSAYISANIGGYDLVLSSLTALTSTTSSTTFPASNISCPASNGLNYTTPSGDVFNIACGIDHYGGDISQWGGALVDSFHDCVGLCASTASCVDVSFVPLAATGTASAADPAGSCYTKSSVQAPVANPAVWSAQLVAASSTGPPPNTAPTVKQPCPDCPNGILPGLQPAAPATLFTLDASTGTLTIADVPGEPYAGYSLSDFDNGDDFYQQDLFGPDRPQKGGTECCAVTGEQQLVCGSGGGGGDGGEQVVWAVCFGGAVFRGTQAGLEEYEREMQGWADGGQGRSPGCQVVEVDVVAA